MGSQTRRRRTDKRDTMLKTGIRGTRTLYMMEFQRTRTLQTMDDLGPTCMNSFRPVYFTAHRFMLSMSGSRDGKINLQIRHQKCRTEGAIATKFTWSFATSPDMSGGRSDHNKVDLLVLQVTRYVRRNEQTQKGGLARSATSSDMSDVRSHHNRVEVDLLVLQRHQICQTEGATTKWTCLFCNNAR